VLLLRAILRVLHGPIANRAIIPGLSGFDNCLSTECPRPELCVHPLS
jgi:hypothetical protein